MAVCALDAAQPELARGLIERAIAAGDDSPPAYVIAGRVAMTAGNAPTTHWLQPNGRWPVRKQPTTSKPLAPRSMCAAARSTTRVTATRRGSRGSGKPRRPRPPGSPKRGCEPSCSSASSKCSAAHRPSVCTRRSTWRASAGALVEQAWAEENLAIALGIQGDPDAGLKILRRRGATLSRATPRSTSVPARRARRSDVPARSRCGRGVRRRSRPVGADRRLGDSHLRHSRRCRDARRSLRRKGSSGANGASSSYGRSRAACPATRRAGWCGRCAAVGDADDAARALVEARAHPTIWRAGTPGRVLLAGGGSAARTRRGRHRRRDRVGHRSDAVRAGAHASDRGRDHRRAGARAVAAGSPRHLRRDRRSSPIGPGCGGSSATPVAPCPAAGARAATFPTSSRSMGVTSGRPRCCVWSARGCRTREIAERLYLSVRTVETHVSSLLSKLAGRTAGASSLRSVRP